MEFDIVNSENKYLTARSPTLNTQIWLLCLGLLTQSTGFGLGRRDQTGASLPSPRLGRGDHASTSNRSLPIQNLLIPPTPAMTILLKIAHFFGTLFVDGKGH